MPRKAAYKAFIENPDTEFDFYLAEKLHMPVGEMRDRIPNDEYVGWYVYFAKKEQTQELARRHHGG